ncbi:MAG: penicillin-binding protein 2, partial [Desulfobacteraceae bacterium]
MRISSSDPISIEALNKHLTVVTCLILAAFLVIVLRLWFLQVVRGNLYRMQSERNRIHLQDIPPFRGLIFDRHGELLVDNRPSYNVFITPEEIQDREQLLVTLERMLYLDRPAVKKKIEDQIKKYPFRPVLIKKNISREELAVVETNLFNLPGVMIRVNPQRFYLFEKMAAHVIGHMGEIGESELAKGQYPANKRGDLIGKYGVEGKWQEVLSGLRGEEQIEVDAAGRRLKIIDRRTPLPGKNITLTIDRKLQILAEECLKDKKGAIVAMDPNTGEILALASSPAFDPNLFIGGIENEELPKILLDPNHPLQNRAIAGVYPPGSIFKIVVALAGLQEGLLDPKEEVVCNGVYTLGNHQFKCWMWSRGGHGRVGLQRAIIESCDVYFYRLGRRLGVDLIAQYANMCGFGKKTGFELGFEKEGLIPTNQWRLRAKGAPWQPGDTINMSIGQGFVLVTPIQAANLISAIFNGGILYQPGIIKQITDNQEVIFQFQAVPKGQLQVKPEYLDLIKQGLIGVVNEG